MWIQIKQTNDMKVEGRLLGKRKEVMVGWTCQSMCENVTVKPIILYSEYILINKILKLL